MARSPRGISALTPAKPAGSLVPAPSHGLARSRKVWFLLSRTGALIIARSPPKSARRMPAYAAPSAALRFRDPPCCADSAPLRRCSLSSRLCSGVFAVLWLAVVLWLVAVVCFLSVGGRFWPCVGSVVGVAPAVWLALSAPFSALSFFLLLVAFLFVVGVALGRVRR